MWAKMIASAIFTFWRIDYDFLAAQYQFIW